MDERTIAWTPVDPLGEALHFLRLTGTFYCRSELSAPWGLTMPRMPGCLWFHAVTDGRCLLDVDTHDPIALGPGDFALVPHGRGHRMFTDPGAETPVVTTLPDDHLSERYSWLRYGGGGARTTLVCGVVRFDHPSARELAAVLPPVIHLGATSTLQSEWMESTLCLMAAEAKRLRPGGETIVTRLADVLVIHAIRAWLERDPAHGWLGALQNRQIGQAMVLVQRDPARDWSVASLAAAVAMSRSAFAARFTALVGEPPMHYVGRLRMRLAAELLASADVSLASVADRFGYRSEAAFSRAFKRFIGVSPGAMRREPLLA